MSEPIRLDDRSVEEGYVRGEPSAARLVDRWIDSVLRGYYRSLESEWEDLKQEVRIRLLRSLANGRFDGRSSLQTYVHRIARNACIDFTRWSWRPRDVPFSRAFDPERVLVEEGPHAEILARDLLTKLFRDVSSDDRTIVHLLLVENRSYKEVAERMNIPLGTLKSRLNRCKARLLGRLRELENTRRTP